MRIWVFLVALSFCPAPWAMRTAAGDAKPVYTYDPLDSADHISIQLRPFSSGNYAVQPYNVFLDTVRKRPRNEQKTLISYETSTLQIDTTFVQNFQQAGGNLPTTDPTVQMMTILILAYIGDVHNVPTGEPLTVTYTLEGNVTATLGSASARTVTVTNTTSSNLFSCSRRIVVEVHRGATLVRKYQYNAKAGNTLKRPRRCIEEVEEDIDDHHSDDDNDDYRFLGDCWLALICCSDATRGEVKPLVDEDKRGFETTATYGEGTRRAVEVMVNSPTSHSGYVWKAVGQHLESISGYAPLVLKHDPP